MLRAREGRLFPSAQLRALSYATCLFPYFPYITSEEILAYKKVPYLKGTIST